MTRWRTLVLVLCLICARALVFRPRLVTRATSHQRTSLSRHHMVDSGIAAKLGSIVDLIKGRTMITPSNIEDTIKEMRTVLLDADVNLQVVNALLTKVKDRAVGMTVQPSESPGKQFISLIAAELVEVMGSKNVPLNPRVGDNPATILLVGLQGAGKTTVAAKLANWVQTHGYGKKVLLVAADVFRPAAVEQLQTLGAKLGVDVYSDTQDTSAVQICRRAYTKARVEGYDTVIVDTAGRQVIDAPLMQELKQLKSAIVPDEVLLVVDAMTGQEAATLTARFNEQVGITGAVLTKLDGDARGGAALSIRGVSGKPIKFVGVGEGLGDLEPFYPERMATRILGMGDVATLLEKAQTAMSAEQAQSVTQRMQKGAFDFNDYLQQSQNVRKMGGMAGVLKLIPGVASKVSEDNLFDAERRMKIAEKIVGAMTEEERSAPDMVVVTGGKKEDVAAANARRKRIAEQTGLSLTEILLFMDQFVSMRKMMAKSLKGVNLEGKGDGSEERVLTDREQVIQDRAARKAKPSKGGGGGFSKHKA